MRIGDLNTNELTQGEREILTLQAREILEDCGPDVDGIDEMELEDMLDALDP